MSDTRFIEDGHEWPRRYTPAELEAIAKTAGVEKCGPVAHEKLQRAVEAYQWATSGDPGGIFVRSLLERCSQLNDLFKLCTQKAPAEELKMALSELDATTYELLGRARADDPRHLQQAVIPTR
jgi:hypothetical protein